ncbi:hypothetical protein EJ08DRAFT_700160 [Tothia fuscella]|uniref:TPR-like protein n=1 Tax=Tothia fuscella TaxID=1048955 RepID=A0A9P4NKI7_9PEZI|nr:hypothetical protein EJ08DRAFT_700160 [Tothia fuscella]
MANRTNGVNGHAYGRMRWADIPPAIDIPVQEGEDEEAVEVNLTELLDDPTELCTLLENERVAKSYWMVIALAYAKQDKMDLAIDILKKGLSAHSSGNIKDRLSLLSSLCWMYLWKCRHAPRIQPDSLMAAPAFYSSAHLAMANASDSEIRTKDFWLREATSTLNDASRISPSYQPLYLARGVLSLLRASLQHPEERADTLKAALRSFEEANRGSRGTNIMAMLGKARVLYSQAKYGDAYSAFQMVLQRSPNPLEPDPRIGLGCCLWQLGHLEDAKQAWERALDLNPDSNIANMLLGLYHLHASAQYDTRDPKFQSEFAKGMTQYTQKSFKLNAEYPLTCANFATYFLMRRVWGHVQKLATRAIEGSDVSAVASDGWYLLARMAHYQNETAHAFEYYSKADQARGGDGRGGDDKGHLPAKFGMAQIKVLQDDFVDAKFRLEKLHRLKSNPETMTLLGTLHAEDYFSVPLVPSKDDDKTEVWKKAIALLDSVRQSWKDPKKKISPDPAVLLNLARLYEIEAPGKSLQCLQEVEQLELERMPDEKRPQDMEDEEAAQTALREELPPQLLNNIGCFHYQADRFGDARQNFQTALNACIKIGQVDSSVDTDALLTTISFNLGRTYEAEGLADEAKSIYESLLVRHPDYLDASARLAYISLKQDPSGEGPKAINRVYYSAEQNLEVRSMYGWYLNKSKKKTQNVAEDQEQRHYKRTLQNHRHDLYSLTADGNLHLTIAREMPRATDGEKDKRHKMYEKGAEFFAKALEVDPKNAYAAQGIAITLVEDRKDLPNAIQVFSKVRETMKDPSVSINLGHAFCELKQYSRAIENYETALNKDRANDVTILACLGRVWMLRGKAEKKLDAMKKSLDYSVQALAVAPHQIHFKFNVAYVQIQIAQLIITLPNESRSVAEVETALAGLDAAIDSFSEIAKAPNPPFPRNDLEQRANMGRNTMRKQVERVLRDQKEYEQANADKLAQAREAREAEARRREEEKRIAAEKAEEARQKILEERLEMQKRDRELAEARAEEERRREEEQLTTDTETGEKKKRIKKKGGKRKKKDVGSDTDGDLSGGDRRSREPRSRARSAVATGDESEEPKRKKKRKLERKSTKGTSKAQDKYKSAEFINDDDDDDEELPPIADTNGDANGALTPDSNMDEDQDEPAAITGQRRKAPRVVDDDDEEEDVGDVSMQDLAPAAVEDESE